MKVARRILAGAAAVAVLAGCSGGQPTAPQTMTAPDATATIAASPSPTPQKLPAGGTYEGIQVDAALVEVKKDVKADYRDDTQIAALVRICSKSDAEIFITSTSWALLDNDDGRYPATSFVFGTGLEPAFPEGERLNKDDCVRGWLAWDTPQTTAVAIRYRPDSEPGGTWTL